MKKLALFLAIAMVVASCPAFALVHGAIDGVNTNLKGSDVLIIEDTGLLMDGVHKGVHQTYDTVTKPMNPILKPILKVRDVTLDSSKMIINKTWDLLTFYSPHKHLRSDKG